MIKEDTRNRWADKLSQPIFTIAMVFLFFGTVFYLISGFRSAFPNGVLPKGKTYPPKTLSYIKVKEEKNEYGQFNSEFKISIHTPFGNPTNTFSLRHMLMESECHMAFENVANVEWTLGLASTTNNAYAYCTTATPIIDNGKLFEITEE